jgi:hypothetical protein
MAFASDQRRLQSKFVTKMFTQCIFILSRSAGFCLQIVQGGRRSATRAFEHAHLKKEDFSLCAAHSNKFNKNVDLTLKTLDIISLWLKETYAKLIKKTDYVLKLIKQQTEMAKKLHQTKSYIVSST